MYRKMIIQAGPERFAGYLNGELVGEKSTCLEAEQMLDKLIYELYNPRPVRQREYRIAWQSKRTGFEGHGQWLRLAFPILIQMTVRQLNQAHPDIDHWIEERDTTTTRPDRGAATEEDV